MTIPEQIERNTHWAAALGRSAREVCSDAGELIERARELRKECARLLQRRHDSEREPKTTFTEQVEPQLFMDTRERIASIRRTIARSHTAIDQSRLTRESARKARQQVREMKALLRRRYPDWRVTMPTTVPI